jgi:hypothetical protein
MPPNLTLENVPGLSPNSQVDAISAVWFAQYGAVGKYKDQAGLLYHCLLANHEWDNTVDMESHPNEDEYLYNQMLAVTANSIPDDPEDGDYTAWRRTDEGRRAKYVFARRFVDAWDEMDNLNETAVEDVRETILYDDEAMILLDRRLEKQSDKIMTIGLVDKLAELHDLGMRLRWEEQESESEEPSSDSATGMLSELRRRCLDILRIVNRSRELGTRSSAARGRCRADSDSDQTRTVRYIHSFYDLIYQRLC